MQIQPTTDQVKFKTIFYGTEAPLVIFMGPDMVYEELNDTYQSIYAGRSLLGRPLLEAVPELSKSPFPAILKKVYETGENFISHEGLVLLNNNLTGAIEERYFDTTFSRIDYKDGSVFRILATPNEVTEKVLARKKLEQNLIELEQEKELREKFVWALSHDLRTPLTISRLSAQILKIKSTDSETFEVNVDRILSHIDRANRMIHDLLDANRLKTEAELPIFIEQCQIEVIVAQTIKDLESIFGKRFLLQNSVSELTTYWDKIGVHRLIENLASNAVKYGAENALVTIGLKRDGEWLEISVHNVGNPIASEDQKLLFHPFRRTESAKASNQRGWGIGLSIVQALARAHGGSISLLSSADQGTTFCARLPIDARSVK